MNNTLLLEDRRSRGILVWVVAVGLGIRLYYINWGLPELYEEAFPLTISWKFWNWGQSGFDFNPHFFNYPAFTLYLNFIVQSLHFAFGYVSGMYADLNAFQQAYNADPTIFVILARLVSVLFDGGTIIALYFLGKEAAGRNVGLVASILGATNLLLVKQSHFVNVDTPLTFFVTLSLLFLYRVHQQPERRWYIFAGITIGLAAASKYTGALLLLVLFSAHVARAASLGQAFRSLKDANLGRAVLTSVIAFLVCNPYVILSHKEFIKDFSFEESHMATGHLGVDPTVSTFQFYFFQSILDALGWILFGVVVFSAAYLLVNKKKAGVTLLIYPVLYLIVICTWKMRVDRYLLPIIPVMIVFGSTGIVNIWEAVTRFVEQKGLWTVKSPVIKYSLGFLICVVVVGQPLIGLFHYQRGLSLPDTRMIAKQWIKGHYDKSAAIASVMFGIDFPDSSIKILPIPFLAVSSERVAPFYDTRWYADCDLVVGTSFDYDRYAKDPSRYREFLAYYDSLRRWDLVFKVIPEINQSGPAIWLYTPPAFMSTATFDADLLQKLNTTPESLRVSDFLANITMLELVKRKLKKAEQILRIRVSVENKNALAYKQLAAVLVEQNMETRALDVVQEYVQRDSTDAEIFWLMGNILVRLNRVTEGEAALLKALSVNAHLESAYEDLLAIYAHRKDKPRALDILRRHYSILPPGSPRAKLIARDIEYLKRLK